MSTVENFGLFVSAVEGHPVRRFGTPSFIGAAWHPDTVQPAKRGEPRVRPGGKMVYDTKTIVAISHVELRRYRREYNRAVRAGSLRRRPPEAWTEQTTAAKKEADAKLEEIAKDKAAKAEAAEKAAEEKAATETALADSQAASEQDTTKESEGGAPPKKKKKPKAKKPAVSSSED